MKVWWYRMALAAVVAIVMAGSVRAQTDPGAHQTRIYAKFLYGYTDQDQETRTPGREDFTTSLIDAKIEGLVSEHLNYMIEFSSSYNPERRIGGFNGPGSPNEVGTIGVRRVSMTYHDLVPWLRITAGTFIPPLGNYQAREVNDLDLIQYPLMYNARGMLTGLYGNHPMTRDLATWQQAGINADIQFPYMLKMQFGYWDGTRATGQANVNPDLGKASSFILTFQPRPPLVLTLGVWNERFQQAYPGLAKGAKRNLTMWYLYGSYTTEVLEITVDYGQGNIPDGQVDNTGDTFAALTFEGYQVTVGYWISPKFEVLARYERFDPNSIDSVRVSASRYDASRWITFGLNYRLNEQAELSLNYIAKTELAQAVDNGDGTQDPLLNLNNPKYASQLNNLFLLQFQVWQ